jgi:hypothetical protein
MNWQIFDVQVGIGDIPSILALQGNPTSISFEMPQMPSDLSDFSDFYGKNISLQAGGFTSFTLPCFGMAGFYSINSHALIQNPAFPNLDLFYMTDYGVRIGGGVMLAPALSLGLDVKRVTRKGGPYSYGASSLTSSSAIDDIISGIEDEGVGYGLDAGLASRFSMLPFNPTLSLSWRDIGSMSFIKTKGTDEPDRQKDNLVAGITIDGSVPLLGMAAGFEYRHITDTNEQIGKKLHFGAEVSIAFIDVRAGFSQGYYSYGLGVDLWLVKLDAALYQVETGIYPGQTPEQRANIGLMLDLEFDPNFNLVDANGRKRRLKQRR